MSLAANNTVPEHADEQYLTLVRRSDTLIAGDDSSSTVIFPFINQFIEELKITDNPDKVGFYSGLVESVFAFVQFFTVYHWAKLSE